MLPKVARSVQVHAAHPINLERQPISRKVLEQEIRSGFEVVLNQLCIADGTWKNHAHALQTDIENLLIKNQNTENQELIRRFSDFLPRELNRHPGAFTEPLLYYFFQQNDADISIMISLEERSAN